MDPPKKPQSLKRNVSRGIVRASASHLLCICDDMEVQRALPQYILVKAALVSEDTCYDLRRSLPSSVDLLRMPRAWMDTKVMLHDVDDLAEAVFPRHGKTSLNLCRCLQGSHKQKSAGTLWKACLENVLDSRTADLRFAAV